MSRVTPSNRPTAGKNRGYSANKDPLQARLEREREERTQELMAAMGRLMRRG